MKVLAIRDQVVVSKHKDEEKRSAGGIIQVTVSSSRSVEGTVVSVGSGRVTMSGAIVPLEVVVGDKVLFNPSQATEVQADGETFLVLREDALIVLR
jgi:chaperonin GroES